MNISGRNGDSEEEMPAEVTTSVIGIFIAPQADLALDKNVKLTIKPEFYLSDFFLMLHL